ncbi:MAG: rRNA maturation RNase YbeY [Kiritimatiellales bacterium]|nr:rRNA maturation RNase YbeY [Kiritimatiellales bacterium]
MVQKLTRWLGDQLSAKTEPDSWSEITVLLVDDLLITEINRDYFGKNRPTDVISFRYEPVPGEAGALSGDIMINVQRAVSEGRKRGNVSRELALYIAHGINHLGGADDDTPEKRKKMRTVENAWLQEATRLELIDNLLTESL